MKFEQEIDGATVRGEIIDAQSFFNLNTLGTQSSQQAFTQLILSVDPDIKKDQAQQIVQATYQWITSLQQIQQQAMQQTSSQTTPNTATPPPSSTTPPSPSTSDDNPSNENTNNTAATNNGVAAINTLNTVANSNASNTFILPQFIIGISPKE